MKPKVEGPNEKNLVRVIIFPWKLTFQKGNPKPITTANLSKTRAYQPEDFEPPSNIVELAYRLAMAQFAKVDAKKSDFP